MSPVVSQDQTVVQMHIQAPQQRNQPAQDDIHKVKVKGRQTQTHMRERKKQPWLVQVVQHLFSLNKVSDSTLVNGKKLCWESFTPQWVDQVQATLVGIQWTSQMGGLDQKRGEKLRLGFSEKKPSGKWQWYSDRIVCKQNTLLFST